VDERAFVARVEAADAEELIKILQRPMADEERAMRVHFGDERYERMHNRAVKARTTRGTDRRVKGNVVVLHGIMGGELTVKEPGSSQHIWMSIPRLIIGAIGWLRCRPEGPSLFDVQATGILKKYYGEMLLALAQDWNVRAFWYDWRKDLRDSSTALNHAIKSWFGDDAPVHLVAHSMGGLVSRTFTKMFPARWKTMWDRKGKGAAGGRLVMLGTPNHGSFAIPQVITGLNSSVSRLATADLKHSLEEVLEILNSFTGSYQMLPSPLVMPKMADLYKSSSYGGQNVPQNRLDLARRHHDWISSEVDGERMIYVAGCNQLTDVDIKDMARLNSRDAYVKSFFGDGTVPHELGFLKQNGKRIPTFFVELEHGNMPADEDVIRASDELMETGHCQLDQQIPARRALDDKKRVEAGDRLKQAQQTADELRLKALTERLRPQARGVEAGVSRFISADEREAAEIILEDFLRAATGRKKVPMKPITETETVTAGETSAIEVPRKAAADPERLALERIEIGLVQGAIENIDELGIGGPRVDAISVGHYIGVKPQAAERALDDAISRKLPGKVVSAKETSRDVEILEPDLLLTQFSQRGTIRGELGQPFFLQDPRDPRRIIALAGMGIPGRFGAPELTVLAQELCWSLGRMGKRHLVTVLIGAGNGNLSIADAVNSWMRGIGRAVSGSMEDQGRHLTRVTFLEYDPAKMAEIDEALKAEKERLRGRLRIEYQPLSEDQLEAARREAFELRRKRMERELKEPVRSRAAVDELIPVRVTVAVERKTYQFAAITQSASIPQRNIPLDPALVMQANDELAGATGFQEQLDTGRMLEALLMPADIRPSIYTSAPLVLMLDATTARVHWEMMAQSDALLLTGSPVSPEDNEPPFDSNAFLGTSRGLTRQLRTTFAPPPEPPPPPRRKLSVLVVADPADDAPLPGAQAEGEEVAALFESFNGVYRDLSYNQVEVVRLFGPYEATRTNVLRHLMFTKFDVLHFAGHCVFDEDEPSNSGWIFSRRERLTANELNRVDRIPKFIFSNACESGITPDRSELRNAALAPSFAEAFFQRGVANFVCTAWPVDDQAARRFARRLYSGLLGLIKVREPEPIHVAMREARVEIATRAGGRTWGAYQHYGNPYFRFFDAATMILKSARTRPAVSGSVPKTKPAKKRRTRSQPRRRTATSRATQST
jgi:CHAT domain/Lecithin:cholesterol acyltransferase